MKEQELNGYFGQIANLAIRIKTQAYANPAILPEEHALERIEEAATAILALVAEAKGKL